MRDEPRSGPPPSASGSWAPEAIGGDPGSQGEGEAPPGLAPGLYVVATPIGNLRDITLRARDTLAAADVVLCEDTRVTATLLRAHGVATPTLSYHEHNADARRPAVLARLDAGAAVALVADAGTPLVSDPGYKLVRAAREAGHAVTPIPGASALLAAVMGAGLPTDRFLFQGFLPAKRKARRDALAEIAGLRATLVVYESPRRLAASLADMADILGDREAVVARELTKRFEDWRWDRLRALAARYDAPPKGEVAVVIGPPAVAPAAPDAEIDARLAEAMTEHTLRDAVTRVTEATGAARKRVYRRALALKDASA
jgi:16S rRNA (cytidine1402-2'-O)-methyltransferase